MKPVRGGIVLSAALLLLHVGAACTNESGVCDPDRPKTCPTNTSSARKFGCSVTSKGCACAGDNTGTAECSTATVTGAKCCATNGWPTNISSLSTCECKTSSTSTCESGETEVSSCSTGDATTSSSSSSSSGAASTCSDKGFCGPTLDACACGLTCLHLSTGSYSCDYGCAKDSDCVGKKDPKSGELLTQCALTTLSGYCK